MKRLLSMFALVCLFGMAEKASADDCLWPYLGVIGGVALDGVTSNTVSLDTGYSFGAVAGLEMCQARVEAEVAYRKSDVTWAVGLRSSGNFSLVSYMVNGFYEFDTGNKRWRPYVGGGVGMATVDSSTIITDSGVVIAKTASDSDLAYQGIAGVGYYLTKHVVLDASYRYFSTAKLRLDTMDLPFTTHNVAIGARYRF